MVEFNPRLKFKEIEYLRWGANLNPEQIIDDDSYQAILNLTNIAMPSSQEGKDTYYKSFYLPLKKGRQLISIPVQIIEYDSKFYLFIFKKSFEIGSGGKCCEQYRSFLSDISSDIINFFQEYKNNRQLIEETFPKWLRTGKIKQKYLTDKLISLEEAQNIERMHKMNLENCLYEISLNEYLGAAGICYDVLFNGLNAMSNVEKYKKFADTRHGGMLEITDYGSKEEFTNWLKNKRDLGAHPFEIVFSVLDSSVHLNPPYKEGSNFSLSIDSRENYFDVPNIIQEFSKRKIPLRVEKLNEILEYLIGEAEINVNGSILDSFIYRDIKEYREKYLPHIKWDELEILTDR